MALNKNQKYTFTKGLLLLLTMYVVFAALLPSVNSPQVRDFTKDLGLIGPMVVIFYTVVSHIFAPIAGTPGILLGINLFGYANTLISVYIACIISAAINFWISRKFGRDLVKKLIGEKSLKTVDELAQIKGTNILIVSRLIGFPLFELVSYAFGLTNMKFKNYLLVNILVNPIPLLLQFIAFRDVDFTSKEGILAWLISLIIIGSVFTYYIQKHIRNVSIGNIKNLKN